MNGQSARSGARDLARGRSAVLFMPHDPITECGRAEVRRSARRFMASVRRNSRAARFWRATAPLCTIAAHLLHNRTKTEPESCACFSPMLLSVGAKLSNHITRSWGNDASYHPLEGDRSVCAPACVVFQHRWRPERGARRRCGGDRCKYTGHRRCARNRRTRRDRRYGDAARGEHQQGPDQHHRDEPGYARSEGHSRHHRNGALHAGRLHRHHRHQSISIRGISSSSGAGTTGIYIDDTPIQMRELGFNPDETLPKTFDLDRVEVLRGPQGTLFGSGSEGGTVRYIMTQPSVSRGIDLRAQRSSRTRRMAQPELRVRHRSRRNPIIDGVLGYRASIWYRFDGGWINRVNNHEQVTDQERQPQRTPRRRASPLLWQPNENVKVTPSIMYQNKQQHDLSTYWPAYSDPGAGQLQQRHARTHPHSRPVLSAGDQDSGRLPAHDASSRTARTTIATRPTRTREPAFDLAYYQALGWPNALCDPRSRARLRFGIDRPGRPTLLMVSADRFGKGIHMPPGFPNYATPNTMTNNQRSWTQEFRLQSNDDSSKWTGTVVLSGSTRANSASSSCTIAQIGRSGGTLRQQPVRLLRVARPQYRLRTTTATAWARPAPGCRIATSTTTIT